MEDLDVDAIDYGAVGGDTAVMNNQDFESSFDSYVDYYMDLFPEDCYEFEKLCVCLRNPLLHREAVILQDHGYSNEGLDDRHIHASATDLWEPDPPWDPDSQSQYSSPEAGNISIAHNKHIVPSIDAFGRDESRSIDPEQDQGGVPSEFDRSHAIVPSGSYDFFDYFTFMPVLTSLYYSSECRPVFTEMNNSLTGDAYCFGNVLVPMSALSGSSAVPILHDSARMITESFENALVPRDNDDGCDDDGCDDNERGDTIDAVRIPFQM